jgi:hypothetical protein
MHDCYIVETIRLAAILKCIWRLLAVTTHLEFDD